MLNRNETLKFLFDNNNLWTHETKYEARLLCKSLYEKFDILRDEIIEYILEGPPSRDEESKNDFVKRKEYEIFEMLQYLVMHNLPLIKNGKDYLEASIKNHPEWNKTQITNMSHYNHYQENDIREKSPDEIVSMLKDSEEFHYDLTETLRSICSNDYNWCLKFLDYLKDETDDIPVGTIQSIISGIRPNIEDNNTEWGLEHIKNIFSILEDMVIKRPDPDFWNGLTSIIERLLESFEITPNHWDNLLKKLMKVFTSYEYAHHGEFTEVFEWNNPSLNLANDWYTLSLNHPFGSLTQIYLRFVNQIFSRQREGEKNYELGSEILEFLEYTIQNYDSGTRYGLCILAKHLSKFEFTLPKWTESNLLPLFKIGDNEEQFWVVWSGYLWSGNISRSLATEINETYLAFVKYYDKIGNNEKEGLARHIAGISWFIGIEKSNLIQFSNFIDSTGRIKLVDSWKSFLRKASDNELIEKFYKSVVFPYWDWCELQPFFNMTKNNANKERFVFWELLPFSNNLFPNAVNKAIERQPSEINQPIISLMSNFSKSGLFDLFENECVEFYTKLLKLDQNPSWNNNRWQNVRDRVKESKADADKAKDFLNEFNRKITS